MKALISKLVARAISSISAQPAGNEPVSQPTPAKLFDDVAIKVNAQPQPTSNLAAVLDALGRAADKHYIDKIDAVYCDFPDYRYYVKQIQIQQTANNAHLLTDVKGLRSAVLNSVSKAILARLSSAPAWDLSKYCGMSIAPAGELAGQAVTVWASVGETDLELNVYFDGDGDFLETIDTTLQENQEPVDQATTVHANAAAIAAAPEFLMTLTDASGARAIDLPALPAMIGRERDAAILARGQYVSDKHCVLDYDAALKCFFLTDRSRHGTFMQGAERLGNGERINLLGDGFFTLTNAADAPRIDFTYARAEGSGTPLMAASEADYAATFGVGRAAESAVQPATASAPPAAAPVTALSPVAPVSHTVATPPAVAPTSTAHAAPAGTPAKQMISPWYDRHPVPEPGARRAAHISTNSQETLLMASSEPKPLAWLEVRNAQKNVTRVEITTLPFVIGRAIEGNGYQVDEAYRKVARHHLGLVEQRGNGVFCIDNASPQRPGTNNLTCGERGAESQMFMWAPRADPSDGGWRVLGASHIDSQSVEVRILTADCATAAQS